MAVSLVFTACKKEEEEEPGCTDSTALNYNPNATVDNGSCVYPTGCTDPLAINYDPNSIVDDGSCLYECTDPFATNYLVPTSYHVCEYEADVVFYLDVPAAQYFTNEGIPFLDVYVGNVLAGSMPTNTGFTSTVLCDDLDPEPVHFTYQWEDAQSTTLPWTVRDGTGFIWYDGTNAIICNNCLSLQLTYKKIKEYQDSH
jgi:hypothetical protein